MKKTVIIKEAKTKLSIENHHIVIRSIYEDKIIAFRYIKQLYINKRIDISISQCILLANYFDIFFINHHGTIIGTIKLEKVSI